MFSFDCCEISKNTYFEEHLRTAASGNTEMDQRFPKMMLKKILSLLKLIWPWLLSVVLMIPLTLPQKKSCFWFWVKQFEFS